MHLPRCIPDWRGCCRANRWWRWVSRYRIEPLQASHSLESFDCGDETLNRFLIRFALTNQRARASRTYVQRRRQMRSWGSTPWWWAR